MKLYFASASLEYSTLPVMWLREVGLYSGPHRILASYAYHSKYCIHESMRKVLGFETEIVLDSGAFTVRWSGGDVKLDEYRRWVEWQLSGGPLNFYLNLDVIGDASGTERNQRCMEASGLSPLPVYHVVSPIKVLEGMVERYPYIAIGGLRSLEGQDLTSWMDKIFKITEKKGVKVHGLAVTRLSSMWGFPFESVDSSSWLSAPRYGRLTTYNSSSRKFEVLNLAIPQHRRTAISRIAKFTDGKIGMRDILSLWEKRDIRWRQVSAGLGMYAYIQALQHLESRSK